VALALRNATLRAATAAPGLLALDAAGYAELAAGAYTFANATHALPVALTAAGVFTLFEFEAGPAPPPPPPPPPPPHNTSAQCAAALAQDCAAARAAPAKSAPGLGLRKHMF
jgi:hypothetical protein